MNWKLWTATSLTLALAVTACASPPPTTLNINTQSGSGGSGGDPTSGDTTGVGGEPGGSQGKEYYLAIVNDSLAASCGSCHATGQNGAPSFMGESPDASYNALDQYGGLVVAPENSLLILHGAHTGPALTLEQKNDVINWLTVEADERGLSTGGETTTSGGGPTTTTLKQALDDYAACMDINDWTDNGLDKLYSAQTLNSGPCGGCHSAGDGGNWLSSNTQETFDMNKKFPYIKRQITGTVDEDGNFKDLVAAKRLIQKGAEPCQPNTNCHPAYVLPPNLKTGIDNFVAKTIDKWHNKLCGAMMP
jgi:cytochrome c553